VKYNPEPEEEDLFSVVSKKKSPKKTVSIAQYESQSSIKLEGETSVEDLTAGISEPKRMEYKNLISWQPLPRPNRMEKEYQEQRFKSKKKSLNTIIRGIKRGDWHRSRSQNNSSMQNL